MKKVPEAGVVRKRGRPPKKQLAIEASAPLAAGEGTQLSAQDALEVDVDVAQAPADTPGSEKQNLNLSLKSRHGDKSASLDSVKVTGRKRRQTSSDRTSSGGKRSAPSSRKSLKDKMKTLLSKVVRQKSQKVSQQTQSSTTRPLSRGRSKTELQISRKKKAKLRKFCRSKISTVKSAKTAANELQDSITTEMKRLLTTDGFWSTKAAGSPLSQSADSNLQKQAVAGKKDSRTSTPDITPSGTRRHSLSKPRSDKDEAALLRSNIPITELRRLRTTDGFSFKEAAGASRTSSRDVSPCSSSSLDRGIRLSSRPFSRVNENKNGVKIDDSDLVAIADDLLPARNKMIVKKESCKDKLSGLQKEVHSTMTPAATDDDKFINCESPVSRFRKKHFLDKSTNLTRQKKGSANIQSKKMSLILGTSRQQKLKNSSITTQSVVEESISDPKPSASENVPAVKKNRKVSRRAADKGIAEKTAIKKKKGKQKQRSISNVDSAVSQSVLENGLENENVLAATNFSSNSVSSEMANTSSELLISDLLSSAELKRLNTTAGFWSASGNETVLSVDEPRKLRDVDDISMKEANSCIKPKPARQRSLHSAKFSKTTVTPNSLLQLRKKKLHSLQSKLMKTEQSIPSDDLPEQQLSPLLSISPAPTEEGTGRKSRPRARLSGVRRQRRNKDVTLNQKSEGRNAHETVGQLFNFVHSEINVNESAVSEDLLIGASGSKLVHGGHADLNTSDVGTKNKDKETSVLLVAKHDGDNTEDIRENKTFTETIYKEMYSQTMPETSDVEMDTSYSDTPTGLKTLSKKSKRGRRKLQTVDVHVTPSSSVRTRGRRKVNTLNNSLEVLQNLEPSNKDAFLTSSPATSKVASERQKMKKAKKKSLAKIDLPEHMSKAEIDNKLSLTAGVAEIKIPQTKDNDKDTLTDTETLDNSLEVLCNLEPSSEDALLASSPATSKVAGEKWKMKKAMKESLVKKDVTEHMSEAGIDNMSSHPAEVARDSENDTLTDTKSSTAETDNIEKHVHKDNLFESLGYSLKIPAETSPVSCVNSLACGSKDLCSLGVLESHLPTVENVSEMKPYDCLHMSQSSAKHVSDSIDRVGPQQLKDAELKAADVDKEFLNNSPGKLDSGCPDVCHKDSLVDTSEILQDSQSVIPSQKTVGFGIISPGSVKSGALNDTSLHEREDNSETSAAIESPSCSEENTKKKTDASEKGPIKEENNLMNEKELVSTFKGPEIELDAGKIKLAEPSIEAEVFLSQEDSETVTSTSAGICLLEQFQGSCPQQHLFAEAEKMGSYNISMGNNSGKNRDQCDMLKSSSVDAREGAIDTVIIKPVINVESNVDSVAEASDDDLEMPASLQSLCGQHKNTKLRKRKRKQAQLLRRKMRKYVETADMSVSLDSASSDVSTVPLETADDFNSCEEIAESQQNEELQEANSMVEMPVKRARKRKRNSWQRGVLRKVTNVSRKVKKSAKSPSPEQNDMSALVLNSNDATACIVDAIEEMVALTPLLISDVVDNTHTPDNLQENILLPALTSDCEDRSQISASLQLYDQSASAALMSVSSFKIPDVHENKIPVSNVSKKQISDDSKIQISDDNKIQISDDSKIQVSDNSKIKNFDESIIKDFNESIITDSDASKTEDLGESVNNKLDASKIKDSVDSKIHVLDGKQKNEILRPFIASNSETTAPISGNLVGEKEHMITDTYPPAVTKSLKNMLKKLQTDANLAHADFGAEPYKGKFFRKIQQQEDKEKRLRIRRKLLHADQKVEEAAGEKTAVESQLGISDLPVRKKRGRPKKQAGEVLPKLSPVGMLPLLRSIAPWNKTPPDLSPQDVTDPEFLDVSNSKSTQEAEIVSENVDDSDLHLYLSGVSDEEQSPRKGPDIAARISLHSDVSLYPGKNDNNISMYESKYSNSVVDTDTLFGAEEFTTQKLVVVSGKEPKKRGRPKKGSRGQPPGIPMTDEERLKRKDEENLKRRKALKAFTKECEDQTLLQFLCTSQRSVVTSDCFTVPTFAGSTSTPAGSFSLRKKSTRSPLVMLAMKRKQEEAQYDMEQERRQARLIHLREKRSARESVEGFSEDEVGEESPENLLTCSVVLNDFVKKLQLDELELSSGEEASHETPDNLRPGRESPDYNPFDNRNEDWSADFEEHDSEEWNNNRPSIPRLKLKRIIKKGAESQIKSTKLTAKSPKERQHVPIKLVIKTEPVVEPNEPAGLKLGSGSESSKVERSGFESSYMDFLKKKSQPLPGKREVGSKRSYNVSRPAHLEKSVQNGAADLSAVEILSLPTTGIRGALAVNTDLYIAGAQAASAVRHLSGSTSLSDGVSVVTQTRVSINAHPSDKVSALENAGATKPVLSEDEDDILILDLEEGVVEQNSDDLPSLPGSVSSASYLTSGITNALPALNHESASENHISHVGNVSLSHLQRTYSNDEMGLMFESYNSHKDPDKLDQLDVLQEATDSFVSVGNSEDLSRNIETSIQRDTSQPSNCVFIDSSVKATVSMSQKIMYEVQKSHPDCTDAPTRSSEPGRKTTTEMSDSAVAAKDMADTGALINMSHGDGDTLTPCKKQSVGDAFPRVNRTGDSVIGNTVSKASSNDGLKEGGADSEVLTATSNRTVGYVPSDVSSDSNSVASAGISPLKTGCFKKPGPAGDNNKSPKHSAYHGSVPEDWRIKVILHSDKFSSGKYSCKRCSFTAPAKLTIESHIYSHIPGVQFRCAYCESEFSSMAATSSHLKNTHSLNEAKLHISRHIDEKNFYDMEAAMFSEESGQQSPVHPTTNAGTNAGGQSPPVIISVVVSSRSGRSSSAPSHRFVCTHCGFSTNVKEDAEHHVLDLHSSQALFACLLCSENVCYTESDIKDHCAIVHPARKHPYKKLPDFYDAELLSAKEKTASQDDRENIFERMTSLFHDEAQPGISTIDHRQKAKEYLYLQEGWREKTKVEADSTTAVDYPDEQDDTEERSSPLMPVPVESPAENIYHATVGENEVIADHRSGSEDSEGLSDVPETPALITDDIITSSARAATNVSNDSQVGVDTGSERCDQQTELEESFSDQLVELPSLAVRDASKDEHIQQECHIDPDLGVEDNDEDGGGMGLKIVQVVSLSEQSEDPDEQIGSEEVHMGTDNLPEGSDTCQAGNVMPESSLTGGKEFSGSEHSTVPANNVTMTEISVPSSVDKDTATSGTVATTESTSSASSPIASPSFAGGLPLSYKCNACKVHTPYLLMMVKHLKAKHPNMRCFSCPYCKTSQSFISQKQLRHHIKQSHPTKFGRNEIALSEDAKKFVEAMVLPIGPECIRVGNRIVLEEDIHTCTYCQVKMVSLTSVYEHLNTKHSDLFEFVCPECQSYRSKLLPEIFEHCLRTHKSSLDTDKVHVSVPKNLFTALTCISKSGKYIEKTLGSSPEKIRAGTSSSTSQQPQKTQGASLPQRVPQLPTEGQISSAKQHPLREASSAATPLIPVAEAVQTTRVMQPIFAVPLTGTSIGAVPAVARPAIAFSSSLFDTSSLTPPQLAVASHSAPFIQNAAAASFLSPSPQQAHSSHHQHLQSNKQSHSKPSERTHGSAKNLPVLNVPTIRPRTSQVAAKPVVGSPVDAVPLSASNCNFSVMSTSGAGQQPFRSVSSSSIIDSLPDDEPNPDAFKIFNLCPTGPRISPSPVSSLPPGVPTVFPHGGAPMAAGYIQGPLAGFPPGMVISPNMLPFSFPYSQNQSLMQGLLAQKQNPQNSPLSRHSHLPHTSALMAAHSASARRNNMSSEEATAYLKKHQQRELYLKKQQHHHQQQLQSQRHLFKQSQQSAAPRAHPAHQQPPSLSGQVYQPQPLPVQTLPYDHHQSMTGPNDSLHPSLFSSSVPVSSAAGPSGHLMAHCSPSPVRPSKGLHKRSNTLYQCPYCPVMVTLKALEVASHIQQHHPGKQVTFRKIS